MTTTHFNDITCSELSSDICMNMRVQLVWGTIRLEWWSFFIAVGLPPLVVLTSLYRIGSPQDFEVWQYAPSAIPTLAIIESVRGSPMHLLATNHLTTIVTWLITQVVSVPQYVFIVLYMLATLTTAATTYVVARLTAVDRLWAMVLALAFTLAPARFWFVDVSAHWWIAIPLIWLVVYQWWYRPIAGYRVFRYTTLLMIIPWLGWEYLLWGVVALLLAAIIAAVIRPEWSWLQLLYGVVPLVAMTLLLYGVYPRTMVATTADGIRLLELMVPHRTHWISWLATLGERFTQLEIPRTSTVYGGVLAICGLIILTIRAVCQMTDSRLGSAQPMFVWLFTLVLAANINGWMHLLAWSGVPVVSPQPIQLIVVFGGLLTLVQWLQNLPHRAIFVVMLVHLGMLVDQVPATNIMRHMRQTPQTILAARLTDGAWFGQQALPADVVSVTGLSTIEPGYGRWSDADVADRIRIEVRKPLNAPVTIEIRARGVASNIGVPITVRIGAEEQYMVLDTTVKPYLLTFNQPQGTVVEIIPQPVNTPPPGDIRRIGIFLQSIRVVTP
jgi:hypothetical protein